MKSGQLTIKTQEIIENSSKIELANVTSQFLTSNYE